MISWLKNLFKPKIVMIRQIILFQPDCYAKAVQEEIEENIRGLE